MRLNRRNHAIGLKPMTRKESVVMSIGLFISKWRINDYLALFRPAIHFFQDMIKVGLILSMLQKTSAALYAQWMYE